MIHQLSVFLENKSGRLTEVLEVLGKENIRITALSMADNSDFGILRLIVSDTDKARELLRIQKFTVNVTDVISIISPDKAQDFAKVLKILSDKEISVEYTYAFPYREKSVIILKCSDNEKAIKELKVHEMDLLKASDLFKI